MYHYENSRIEDHVQVVGIESDRRSLARSIDQYECATSSLQELLLEAELMRCDFTLVCVCKAVVAPFGRDRVQQAFSTVQSGSRSQMCTFCRIYARLS